LNQLTAEYGEEFVENIKLNILKLLTAHCKLFTTTIKRGMFKYYQNQQKHKAFQLLGFDVLLDKKGNA